MKKIISLILALVLLISAVNFSYAADGAEVLYSYSFDNGIEDWEYYGKHSPDYVDFAEDCLTNGSKSAHILDISDTISVGLLSPYFDVKENEVYSASVDCYRVSGTMKLYYKFYDKDYKQIFNKSYQSKEGAWQNIVATQTAPKGAVYCRIYFCGDSAAFGEGYFDNFSFLKGTAVSKEIANGIYPKADNEEDAMDNKEAELLFTESLDEGLGQCTLYNQYSADYVSFVNSDTYEGDGAISITDPDDKITAGIKTPYIPVTSGEKYTASFYIKNISGNSTRLYFKYFDKDKKQILSKSLGIKSMEWQPANLTLEAPKEAEFAQIQIVGTIAEAGVAYVDEIKFHKGSYVPVSAANRSIIPPQQALPVKSHIVEPINGKLKYNTYNEQGDTLGDYSYAGFYGGDYELPISANLPVVATLSPSGTEDDTKMIQAAIDKAERKDGGINIVKLKEGTYRIGTQGIRLKSGVLLSGSGQGPDGTKLFAYEKKQYSAVRIQGEAYNELAVSGFITDDYVKSGSNKINVLESVAQSFQVGDSIAIYHISTEEWAKAIKMVGTINVYDNITTWTPGSVKMITERRITGIDGTELTLDFPLFVPYMKELVPSYISKISDNLRVENAGIENLRIESYYNGDKNDEAHAVNAVLISNAKNIFLRDITSKYFYFGLVRFNSGAKQVTVRNCSCLEPVSTITGERRYSFMAGTGSQQVLVSGCYSYDARHDYSTSGQATGPICFVDSVAEMSNTSSETHGTWSTGVLYDNIYHISNVSSGYTTLANRGIYGTALSQGWTSAGCVSWNGLSSAIVVHKPPVTYQNFAVGIWGLYNDSYAQAIKGKNIATLKKIYRTGESIEHTEENFATDENTSIIGDSYKEALYSPVEPRSLYKAQLSERYTEVISNERPNAPIIVNPFPDSLFNENDVKISGIYQLGAAKVTVYIDNIPYEAVLNMEDNTFEVSVNLADGVHKIYATQTIGGYEGNKTADRFISINKSQGNADCLQSIYTKEQATMLLNDTRPTYDEIINGIKVKVNGFDLISDIRPFEANGRVLVPMRAIFEKLNAQVSWDEATSTATAVKDGITVKITENDTKAYVDGKEVILDVPATVLNGRFAVPVRFISEAFGAKVNWIEDTKTVLIEEEGV